MVISRQTAEAWFQAEKKMNAAYVHLILNHIPVMDYEAGTEWAYLAVEFTKAGHADLTADSTQVANLKFDSMCLRNPCAVLNTEKYLNWQRRSIIQRREARQGWVSVNQLLELEGQMHAQIEEVFDTQLRAVALIKKILHDL